MGRSRYKIHESHEPYFVSSTLLEELPLFSKPQVAQVLLEKFMVLQNMRSVKVYAYVIMPNHFHAVVQGEQLSKKLRLTKSYVARQILEVLKRNGHTRWLQKLKECKRSYKRQRTYQVWEEGLHPKQLSTTKMMAQKIEYIHQNPLKAGWVNAPDDWRCSSAGNYLGREGLIPVTLFAG
ncbi:REP-associated tyrosine transposase [Gracilimonas sp.]|uniref:REP-associated tyrosine transposase n=1 Tax=Gracilimonas sp. TaxID=1974203 RepID=UPI003D0BBBAC